MIAFREMTEEEARLLSTGGYHHTRQIVVSCGFVAFWVWLRSVFPWLSNGDEEDDIVCSNKVSRCGRLQPHSCGNATMQFDMANR